MRLRSFRRRMRPKNKKLIVLFFMAGLLVLLDMQVHPLVKTVSQTAAKRVSVEAINTAVAEALSDEADVYGELVHISKDTSGTVTSIQTDSVQMNRLKSEIGLAIEKKLSSSDIKEFGIPIGTVIGGDLLAGRGPRIKIRIDLAGNAFTQFNSVFESAGINQTHHKIMLNVKCDVFIVMPGFTTSTVIDTDFCIAETVIVGKVPDAFTNVDTIGTALPNAVSDYGAFSQK